MSEAASAATGTEAAAAVPHRVRRDEEGRRQQCNSSSGFALAPREPQGKRKKFSLPPDLRLLLGQKKGRRNKEVHSVQKSKQECISFLSFSLTERFPKLVHNSSDSIDRQERPLGLTRSSTATVVAIYFQV